MADNRTQERFAFQTSATIFASSLGFICTILLIEYIFTSNKSEDTIEIDANEEEKLEEKDSQAVKVDDAEDSVVTPRYGPFRRVSQKVQQIFLDYPSSFALCMILVTCLKYFVLIFDMFTDATIASTFVNGDVQKFPEFVISIALITAPCATKWITFSNFLTEKNKQGRLPLWISYLNFFFPLGVSFPFIADLYILSRVLKGHGSAFWTGEQFHLEDDLFSLQRTFALLEAQTESMPQALFQCGILFLNWDGNKDQAGLIFLSVSVSAISMALQFLTPLRTLADKEAYPSIFALIGSLSKGDFISGVNQIKKSTSSILNLSSVFIDSEKMRLVSELIEYRRNLKTIILNSNVLCYPFDFIGPWLCSLNSLKLKFLHARKVEDIEEAFQALDKDGDETISTKELSSICGNRMVSQWNHKYGPEYKMNIRAILGFIRNECVDIPGTSFTIFEMASYDRFPENIRNRARAIVERLGMSVGVKDPLQVIGNSEIDTMWYKNLVTINGSHVHRIEVQSIDSSLIHHLYLPNLVQLVLRESSVKRVDKILHGDLPKLEILDFAQCKGIMDSELEAGRIHLPNLKELDISKSNWENCRSLVEADLPSLRELNVSGCKSLKTEDVDKVGLVALEELDLSYSNWEHYGALFSVEFPSLKKLNMSYCKSLKTEDVDKVGLVALEELDLSVSNWDHCGALFSAELPSLKNLNMSYCRSLKTEDVDKFGLVALEELNLSNSNWEHCGTGNNKRDMFCIGNTKGNFLNFYFVG